LDLPRLKHEMQHRVNAIQVLVQKRAATAHPTCP
jgi:hypothetical protein